jgi:hypothetical protein
MKLSEAISDWIFRKYSGESAANGEKGWLPEISVSESLKAGRVFLILL